MALRQSRGRYRKSLGYRWGAVGAEVQARKLEVSVVGVCGERTYKAAARLSFGIRRIRAWGASNPPSMSTVRRPTPVLAYNTGRWVRLLRRIIGRIGRGPLAAYPCTTANSAASGWSTFMPRPTVSVRDCCRIAAAPSEL